MAIDKDGLDQLLAGRDPVELFAKDGLLDELKKAVSEGMLAAELDDDLEAASAEGAINRRNGSSKKTMLTGTSKVTLDVQSRPNAHQYAHPGVPHRRGNQPQAARRSSYCHAFGGHRPPISSRSRQSPGFELKWPSRRKWRVAQFGAPRHTDNQLSQQPHRPSAQELDGLCLLEGPQGSGDGAQADLPVAAEQALTAFEAGPCRDDRHADQHRNNGCRLRLCKGLQGARRSRH